MQLPDAKSEHVSTEVEISFEPSGQLKGRDF